MPGEKQKTGRNRKGVQMKEIKTLSIKCDTKDFINWHKLTDFQGGLKERNEADIEKAKKSILKYGWSFPVFVWKDGETNYILDGHCRRLVLESLEKEGYLIPELPCVYVEAMDKAEAKQKLLRLNSTFGHLTKNSVLEFAEDIDLNFDEIALPDNVFRKATYVISCYAIYKFLIGCVVVLVVEIEIQ
jgi:hypothetical protein